jgi:hypothetical protein
VDSLPYLFRGHWPKATPIATSPQPSLGEF